MQALLDSGPDIGPQTMADASPWDTLPDVMGIEVPLLILAADSVLGSLVTPEAQTRMKTRPGTRFVRIPGGGHSLHRDVFDEYFVHIREFVGE